MSELRADTITASDGTSPVTLTGQTAAKAWVNFNGTGTVAIRKAFGVSSIADNAVGDYTANFTNAMVDADYSIGFAHQFSTTNVDSGISPQVNGGSTSMTTTTVRVSMVYNGQKYDCVVGIVNLHGDLA